VKKALITGVTGQDGSYLAELLLEKGYEVHGIVRRSSSFNTGRIDHIHNIRETNKDRFFLHYGDLTSSLSIVQLLAKVKPDEVYNIAAQSHVGISFEKPENTADITGLSVLRLLEAVRIICPDARVYQASSSEMFGKVREVPQKETTPFHPRSPYGVSKLFGHWAAINYREAYGLFTVSGILFNHESPRRGRNFVTRKITRTLAQIKQGLAETLYLGNLNARRDWGYAKDYVEAMWLMMQHDKPDDYVVATGENHSVREFVEIAAMHLGFDIEWQGQGTEEKGIDKNTGKTVVKVDPKYFRPAEVDVLLGDPTKAKTQLNWAPRVSFKELVQIMADNDMKMIREKDERY